MARADVSRGRPRDVLERTMPTNEEWSLTIEMRDAAIQYTKQHPPTWASIGTSPTFYSVAEVRGMMADFAGHMILEDRKKRAIS